ncbi:hypothetical protein WA026_017962 [Henosepilachna vigintioctopunctata]|uniref:Uncharacterized protein n=1 Tax=Henosepilachna vigintioctopunctata TaxID=420089 RepID=A0AAW1TWK2_9CUCU
MFANAIMIRNFAKNLLRKKSVQIDFRLISNAPQKLIRNHNELKFLPKEEVSSFMAYFPKVVKDASYNDAISDIPLINKRLERCLNYYGPAGKFLRQHILIYVYQTIENHFGTFDPKKMEQLYQLAWCLEMYNCQFMLLDDLLDNHDVRKGKKAWHKLENIGMSSMMDAFLVQGTMFRLLKKYFSNHPNYVFILENFSKVDVVSAMILETETRNFEDFTLPRHMEIGVSKASYYIMGQPFLLATLLSNKGAFINDSLKKIFDLIGILYTAQNDMLDCYGEEFGAKPGNDIQENRCTALIVLALRKASPKQRKQLEECYGVDDELKINTVKEIYEELDIVGEYHKFEADIHNKIAKEIEEIPDKLTLLLMEKLAYIYTFGRIGTLHTSKN